MSKKEREAIKERYSKFNDGFDSIVEAQVIAAISSRRTVPVLMLELHRLDTPFRRPRSENGLSPTSLTTSFRTTNDLMTASAILDLHRRIRTNISSTQLATLRKKFEDSSLPHKPSKSQYPQCRLRQTSITNETTVRRCKGCDNSH